MISTSTLWRPSLLSFLSLGIYLAFAPCIYPSSFSSFFLTLFSSFSNHRPFKVSLAPMAPTGHSSNFNSAQMATDQREGPDVLSAQAVSSSSVGIYHNSPPPHNPCIVENWARYITQPTFLPSPQYAHHYPPHVISTETYHLPLSHQNINLDNHYVDAYYPSSNIHAAVLSPGMGSIGEAKQEYTHGEHQEWGSVKSPVFKGQDFYHSAQIGVVRPNQNSPASPLSIASSYSSPQSSVAPSPAVTAPNARTLVSNGEAREDRPTNTPYSGLIFKALDSAKGKKLSLQGIYKWFLENTDKGKDENHKGWQNSIRHNLSMNAVSPSLISHSL